MNDAGDRVNYLLSSLNMLNMLNMLTKTCHCVKMVQAGMVLIRKNLILSCLFDGTPLRSLTLSLQCVICHHQKASLLWRKLFLDIV